MAEYRYNRLGQRVAKLTDQGFTTYLYGPDGQLLGESEYDATGSRQRSQSYLWLDSLPLASVQAQGSAPAKVLYLHSDHLNTPRLATSAGQQIVWQWQSDAFGNGTANQDPQGSGQQTVLNLRFPGQYFDAESGLHYNYFRDYDPQTGRYVECDPIGFEGGLNTFGDVDGNPVSYADPEGLHKLDKLYGLGKDFWKWFHRQGDMGDLKGPDGQVPKDVAEDYYREWIESGEPKPDSKGAPKGIDEILESIPPIILPPGFEEACEENTNMFGCPKPKAPMC